MQWRHETVSTLARALLVLGLALIAPAVAAAEPTTRPGFAVCASQASPVSGAVTLSAEVQPEPGLLGVQFKLDGHPLEALDTAAPYAIPWSAASAANGEHTITAEARYASGEVIVSAPLRLTVANPAAVGRTLHVDAAGGDDANDGASPQTAWRTLKRANAGVAAGDTVLLRGTFSGEAIRPLQGGTPEAPITFRSAPGTTAVLDGGFFGLPVWLDAASGRSHIVVEGVAMRKAGVTGIILDGGAHHNVIRNCDLDGVEIRIHGGSSDNLVEGNVVRDVGDEATNTGDAVWIANGASRNRVVNNRLTNAGHSLVQVGGDQAGDADVLDNVVANNVLSNRWSTPLILSWRARRTLVEGNRISDGARNGINRPRPGIQVAASENVIRYNEVVDNAGAGIHLGAYVFGSIAQDSIGNQIYHNVFYGNGTPDGGGVDAVQSGAAIFMFEKDGRAVQQNLVANNVFLGHTGFPFNGATYSIVIEQFQTTTAWPDGSLNGNRLRNNVFLRSAGTAGELAVLHIRHPDLGGNVPYTLAQFESTYAAASGNLEVDPRFTDAANRVFTLQSGSPAIDRGFLIAGVGFQGGAPDIGARETAAVAPPPPPPPPPPPSATIALTTSLSDGQVVKGSVPVKITVTDARPGTNRYYLSVDGVQRWYWVTAATTITQWWQTSTLSPGTHVFSARVVDSAGREASTTVTVRR